MNQNKSQRTRVVRLNLLEDKQQWFKIKVGKFEAGQVQQNGLQYYTSVAAFFLHDIGAFIHIRLPRSDA